MSEKLKINAIIDGKAAELSIDYAELDKYFEHYYDYRLAKNKHATVINDAELLRKAAEIVVEVGKCSTALLQRRLLIGYGKAAALIDELEERGAVGPAPGGNEARSVLITTVDELGL